MACGGVSSALLRGDRKVADVNVSASTRWLIVVAGVTVALVLASVLVAQLAGRETELELDTPEGAVQAYLRAVADGDAQAAYGFYSAALQERCDLSSVRDSLRFREEDFRATLGEVIDRGDTVEVLVDLTQFYGDGPFGRGESTFQQVFILEKADTGWVFVEPPWPTWCPVPVPDGRPSTSVPGEAYAWV